MNFKSVVYRAHDYKWGHDPLSGEGAKRNGGRFNRKGVPALYLSLEIETAFAEVNQCLPPYPAFTTWSYFVNCDDIIDLRDPKERAAHDIHLQDLACSWISDLASKNVPASHKIASKLIKEGAAGILYPSFARRNGSNLVLWKFGKNPPHQIIPYDPKGFLSP